MSETEQLVRKKKVRAGHRASLTRILGEIHESISATPRDNFKISQLKRSLEEKLQTLTKYDEEILPLVPEGDIEEEIVRADKIKE